MNEIVFTDVTGGVPEIYYPRPSKRVMPQWLKHLEPYFYNHNQTAKRCLPMLDAVMTGYTLVLNTDIQVSQRDGQPYYEWPSGLGLEFHAQHQIHTHDKVTGDIPKALNPWAIKTPPGYSCLFIPPLNADSSPIEVFSGVVDTDTYYAEVNFPFRLLDPLFEGTIEAGTPLVQVIPFKREAWVMRIETGLTESITKLNRQRASVFKNAYRRMFHKAKDFR